MIPLKLNVSWRKPAAAATRGAVKRDKHSKRRRLERQLIKVIAIALILGLLSIGLVWAFNQASYFIARVLQPPTKVKVVTPKPLPPPKPRSNEPPPKSYGYYKDLALREVSIEAEEQGGLAPALPSIELTATVTPPAASGEAHILQIASFIKENDAQLLKEQLAKDGVKTTVETTKNSAGKLYYRVKTTALLGSEQQRVLTLLQQAGFSPLTLNITQ